MACAAAPAAAPAAAAAAAGGRSGRDWGIVGFGMEALKAEIERKRKTHSKLRPDTGGKVRRVPVALLSPSAT